MQCWNLIRLKAMGLAPLRDKPGLGNHGLPVVPNRPNCKFNGAEPDKLLAASPISPRARGRCSWQSSLRFSRQAMGRSLRRMTS